MVSNVGESRFLWEQLKKKNEINIDAHKAMSISQCLQNIKHEHFKRGYIRILYISLSIPVRR